MSKKTIIAPSTPTGISALAVIRLSGPDCGWLVQNILKKAIVPNKMLYCELKDPESGRLLDHLMYCYMPGPKTFSGEDCLELFCHGNPLIVRDLVQCFLKTDYVRMAEPGEFSRRAFENNKMDLLQTEGLGRLIHASSEKELTSAKSILKGLLSERVGELSERIKNISVHLELEMDFAEEETDADISIWSHKLEEIQKDISYLIEQCETEDKAGHIPAVVLCGKPNAGKSSLINALLKEERILVSEQAGTTRDYVETRLFLEAGEIRLIDTAGLSEQPVNELDRLSMEKSRAVLKTADLIIATQDGTDPSGGLNLIMDNQTPVIHVNLKSDLPSFKPQPGFIEISSLKGDGLDTLRQRISEILFKETSEAKWIINQREAGHLKEAILAVQKALEMARVGGHAELLAFEIQQIRFALASVTGEITPDDILKEIFSGFCIGK
jgi:tRNA modification GTPase